MYTEHLFTDISCYQRQVFNAYRQMGEEEPCMKPYLLGVGVFGFPIPPHGFSFVDIADGTPPPVRRTALSNKPNPFNPSTTIQYELPGVSRVSLAIYDIAGRKVATLLKAKAQEAGRYEIVWDGRSDSGRNVGSGVYFCRLDTGRKEITRKLVLVK